ncbi:uncharacterized protein TNCV_2326951 [Trichonephila clavipes]|nr:uncharacterized protein TNCV_2326951 [Trichonephila clavipes]
MSRNQGERHISTTDKCGPLIRSAPRSWTTTNNRTKRGRKETLAFKRSLNLRSGGPEKKQRKGPGNKGEKRQLTFSSNNELKYSRKRCRGDEIVMPSTSGYSLRPKRGAKVEFLSTNEKRTEQGGPVRARGSREHQYSPLHRRASKVSRSEDQKQKWSITALPGEKRRNEREREQHTVPISRGSSRSCQLQEIRIRTSIPQYINFCFVDSPVTPSRRTLTKSQNDSSSDPSNAVIDMNDLKPTPKIARPLKETLGMFRKRAKTPTAPSAAARAAACIEEEHRMKIKYMEMDEERKNEEHQLWSE